MKNIDITAQCRRYSQGATTLRPNMHMEAVKSTLSSLDKDLEMLHSMKTQPKAKNQGRTSSHSAAATSTTLSKAAAASPVAADISNPPKAAAKPPIAKTPPFTPRSSGKQEGKILRREISQPLPKASAPSQRIRAPLVTGVRRLHKPEAPSHHQWGHHRCQRG